MSAVDTCGDIVAYVDGHAAMAIRLPPEWMPSNFEAPSDCSETPEVPAGGGETPQPYDAYSGAVPWSEDLSRVGKVAIIEA